jgi:L-gulonate 3-dehydrogenase
MTQVAVVGAGLIGRAWSIVFARAGFDVALWDPYPQQVDAALAFIGERLPELEGVGLLKEAPRLVARRVRPVGTLAEAVSSADHVQENGPERVDAKHSLFGELDQLASPDTVLASSTSGIPASAFTEGLKGRARCLVAHPVNPPYLIPLVEVCPAPWTDPAVVSRTRALMTSAGQVPATVNKEMDGFALNRLQGALLAEAFRLIADDVISPADLDALVKHGLGLRWSFMGPLETIDLNAPGGLKDYCERYGPLYGEMQQQMTPRFWDAAMIDRLHSARRADLPANMQSVRQEWRDRRLMALLAHKAIQPK